MSSSNWEYYADAKYFLLKHESCPTSATRYKTHPVTMGSQPRTETSRGEKCLLESVPPRKCHSSPHFSSCGPCLSKRVIKQRFPFLFSILSDCTVLDLNSSSIRIVPSAPLRTTKMPLAWFAETAGILASASLLIALIVLLAIYDDRNLFEWKGIILNALVSVLSTASKAALLYTTSELISQWKWIVFTSTSRLLIDFQRIDAASRGPLGSSRIIWRSRAM